MRKHSSKVGTAVAALHIGTSPLRADVRAEMKSGGSGLEVWGPPEAVCRDVKVRARLALARLGVTLADSSVLVTATLRDWEGSSPAHVWSGVDLAVVVAVLRALGRNAPIKVAFTQDAPFAGDLGLAGDVRAVRGALARIGDANTAIVLPCENAREIVPLGAPAVFLEHVRELDASGDANHESRKPGPVAPFEPVVGELDEGPRALLEVLRGKPRALVVSPVGSGVLAAVRALTAESGLEDDELREVSRVHGVAGLATGRQVSRARTFRAPHHTCSEQAMIGGNGRPGEASLAHRGVLLLDELPEWRAGTLGALASVLHEGVAVSGRAVFPARPIAVIATATPSPCGHEPGSARCTCSSEAVRSHQARTKRAAAALGLEIVVFSGTSVDAG